MATVDGLPPDPLSLLRKSIAVNTLPIPSTTQDPETQADTSTSLAEASYLIFNTQSPQDGAVHISIPLTQPTRFISPTQPNQGLDLRSIYFCWLNKDTGIGDYIHAVSELNKEVKAAGREEPVTNLGFGEKLDLVTWLAGDVGEEESEYIRSLDNNKAVRSEANDAAAIARGDQDVEMRDAGLTEAEARRKEEAKLREILAAERRTGDRNTVLRGVKIQDFSGVRKYSALFLGKSRPTNQPQQPAPALTNNPALRPPVKAPQPGRRPEPIILLSPSASSLLTMSNIKSFLSDGLYTPPSSGSNEGINILHLTRVLPSISSHPMRFILVDSPDNFRPDYWNRVVAVFTTGQTWQFKNYKWQNPAELFAHALGVYVGWRGEVVPDTVKGWGRGVLTVGIDKAAGQRWRDREVVEDVWGAVEGRMKASGWGKSGR